MKPIASTYRPNKKCPLFTVFHHIELSWKITEKRGVHYSKCLILTGFTGENKSNCKISIWNKLTLHIAQNTVRKNIED